MLLICTNYKWEKYNLQNRCLTFLVYPANPLQMSKILNSTWNDFLWAAIFYFMFSQHEKFSKLPLEYSSRKILQACVFFWAFQSLWSLIWTRFQELLSLTHWAYFPNLSDQYHNSHHFFVISRTRVFWYSSSTTHRGTISFCSIISSYPLCVIRHYLWTTSCHLNSI